MKDQEAKFLRTVGEQDLDAAGKVVDLAEVSEYGDLAAERKISCVKRSQDSFLNWCFLGLLLRGSRKKKNGFARNTDCKIQVYSTKQKEV